MSYYGEPLANLTGLTEFEGKDSVDLLARMIYSEARNQNWACMQGVANVAKNRKASLTPPFNNQDTYAEVLLSGDFDGMATLSAREPVITGTSPDATAWYNALYIASHMDTQNNPIGNRLFFRSSTPPSNAKDVIKIDDMYFHNY
jgi:hypothetical protein